MVRSEKSSVVCSLDFHQHSFVDKLQGVHAYLARPAFSLSTGSPMTALIVGRL